ncbi:MAG: carboxypeptidase regulatory-like domain-containing protein, partial [Gemmatimonadetes bacterium]|nr:carboxypeptidase regulatory-like domain-containing protein [Gemmatimonadota bacterium]
DYPFRSAAAAAELMQVGFVQQVGDSVVYHAPAAHVLLSDEFLDGHCFSVRRATDRPGMIGLAFEPMSRRRHIPGVAGVLWLDESTAELRQMEYHYTRFPPAPAGRFAVAPDPSGFGGSLDFDLLENGAWIVSAWRLLVPSRQVVREWRGGVGPVIRETGGQIAAIAQPGSARRLAARDGAILGRVLDADDRSPVEGAVVYVSGTQHTARTGAAGEFRMANVREGRYLLAVYHPGRELDPALLPGLDVAVRADEDESVELLLPGLTAQLAMRCEGDRTGTGALIAGIVRDAATWIVLPGARVGCVQLPVGVRCGAPSPTRRAATTSARWSGGRSMAYAPRSRRAARPNGR